MDFFQIHQKLYDCYCEYVVCSSKVVEFRLEFVMNTLMKYFIFIIFFSETEYFLMPLISPGPTFKYEIPP